MDRNLETGLHAGNKSFLITARLLIRLTANKREDFTEVRQRDGERSLAYLSPIRTERIALSDYRSRARESRREYPSRL